MVVTVPAPIKGLIPALSTPLGGAHTLNTSSCGSPMLLPVANSRKEGTVCDGALALTIRAYWHFQPLIGRQVVLLEWVLAQMSNRADLSRNGAVTLLLRDIEFH